MSISAQQRTMILAAVAALGVGGVAIDAVLRSKDPAPASASPAPDASQAVSVLPGAPPGDLADLRKRYRPIVLKGPFKKRDFKTRRKARPRETPREDDSEPAQPRKPGDLLLRLTSFLGHGEARVGLFEDRSSGTALFAKPGETLAGVSVKKVESERVVVLVAGKERAYGIGETLTLPASAREVLKPLRPAGSVKTESKRYTGTTKLPELSEKKKMSILERLKARRRASKLRAEGKSPEEAPKKTEKAPEGESKKTSESQASEKTEPAKKPEPAEKTVDSPPEQGDDPAGDDPAGDNPAGDNPAGDDPAGDNPAGDNPAGDDPAGDDPASPLDKPDPDKPDAPADDAPEGGEPSEDDEPADSSAPPAEPSSPEPKSEDNQ